MRSRGTPRLLAPAKESAGSSLHGLHRAGRVVKLLFSAQTQANLRPDSVNTFCR